MQNIYEDLIKVIDKDRIFINEPMCKHTSFKIGGPADFFIKVNSIVEIKYILKIAKNKNIPIKVIGNGTNILVSDKGYRGIIIKLNINNINLKNNIISAEAGVTIPKLARFALDNSLSGMENLSGIPGTIGGALKMNAGAYGDEIKSIILETTYLNDNLETVTISNEEHEFGYRKSLFSDNNYIILETKIKLTKSERSIIENKMKEVSTIRKEKQPLDYPSAGSIFKRGKDYIPAELIDKAGLKGYNIGDAYISEKHAGFIINKGNANAEEVLKLAEFVKKEIYKKYNKTLELEVEFIGE